MGVDSGGAAGLRFVVVVMPWSVSVTWQVYARSSSAHIAGALLHKPPGTSCTSVGWSSPHYPPCEQGLEAVGVSGWAWGVVLVLLLT
jgi:hypothetical protein